MTTTLARLQPGARFRVHEAPEQRGTLVKINDCRALVRFERAPSLVSYDTADGRHVEFYRQAEPVSVTPYLEVDLIG